MSGDLCPSQQSICLGPIHRRHGESVAFPADSTSVSCTHRRGRPNRLGPRWLNMDIATYHEEWHQSKELEIQSYQVYMAHYLQGFANCALLAIWAVGDQVFIGVMGGEAEFPRWSLARSANMVPTRLGFMYILSVVFIGLLVPSDDHRLLSGSGVTASPFVIAVTDAGIPGLPGFINVCMIIGILAIALECIYLPSRILRTMSLQGFLPQFIANVDSRGRPRWALAITSAVALLCTYIGLSSEYSLARHLIIVHKANQTPP
jgi:amino acid permease